MGIDLIDGVKALALAGLTRVLVEGGGQVAASFIRADLVDRIAWFHAPAVMGGDGWPSVQGFGIRKTCYDAPLRSPSRYVLGSDMLTEFKRPILNVYRDRHRHSVPFAPSNRSAAGRTCASSDRGALAGHGINRSWRFDRLFRLLPHGG
jgi:hypothetical protein